MKDTTTQGETKSAPAEIRKFVRTRCETCGLEGPAEMVTRGFCLNAKACARRVELAAKRLTTHPKETR